MSRLSILYTGLDGLIGNNLAERILQIRLGDIHHFSMVRDSFPPSHDLIASRILPDNLIVGDCSSFCDLVHALRISRPSVIVHIAQMRFTATLLRAIDFLQISPRLIIVGTTGVFSRFPVCNSSYQVSENALLQSSHDYVVIRPSMIYGSPFDKNMHFLFSTLSSHNIFFLPGNGLTLFQPVFYKDIGYALYFLLRESLQSPALRKHGFLNLPGPETISLRDVIDIFSNLLGKSTHVVNIPLPLTFYLFSILSYFNLVSKSKCEQILRLSENKYYSSNWASLDPSFKPTTFRSGADFLSQEFSKRHL